MILLLPEDLIDEKNYGEVYELLDSACIGINIHYTDEDGNKTSLKEVRRNKLLKRLEELGETKVLENYKNRFLHIKIKSLLKLREFLTLFFVLSLDKL